MERIVSPDKIGRIARRCVPIFGAIAIMTWSDVASESLVHAKEDIAVVALGEKAEFTTSVQRDIEELLRRNTGTLIDVQLRQTTASPEQVAQITEGRAKANCPNEGAFDQRAREVLDIPDTTRLILTTTIDSCGGVSGTNAGYNSALFNMSSLDPETQVSVAAHELLHSYGVDHESGINFSHSDNPTYVDEIYETLVEFPETYISPRDQAAPYLEYGKRLDCNVMTVPDPSCRHDEIRLSPIQKLYIARSLGEQADVTVHDLGDGPFNPPKFSHDWVAQVKLPTPFVTVKAEKDSTSEQAFSTLSIAPDMTHLADDGSPTRHNLYLSNEDSMHSYKTILLGSVPASAQDYNVIRDKNTPSEIIVNRIKLIVQPDGALEVTAAN